MKGYLEFLKGRLVLLLIGIPIALVLGSLFSDKTINAVIYGIGAVGLLLLIYNHFEFRRALRQLKDSQERAEHWKRRISSVADSIELPIGGFNFDELCEYEENAVLAEVVHELEKLPLGKRDLKRAYEVAGRRRRGASLVSNRNAPTKRPTQ